MIVGSALISTRGDISPNSFLVPVPGEYMEVVWLFYKLNVTLKVLVYSDSLHKED